MDYGASGSWRASSTLSQPAAAFTSFCPLAKSGLSQNGPPPRSAAQWKETRFHGPNKILSAGGDRRQTLRDL